ncbi:carbohydrate ABC transporter permease [Candidatus Aerophobetes bacterium]|nr:carbohydrate ABC transporter permease [Candidatus Aerophobetes bacterium]
MKQKEIVKMIIKYGIFIAGGICMFFPFLWLILASLQSEREIMLRPMVFIPEVFQWQNYVVLFKKYPLDKYYFNSFLVNSSITGVVLLTSSLAGYSLAKLSFPGRELIFKGILATMMFPVFLFLIPVYYLLKRVPLVGGNDIWGLGGVGFLHSYPALILPFIVNAWGIFLMRQFIIGIPNELLDAARIDGCSEFRIYANIILPLTRPALATLGIFIFIQQWNSFLWPLIITTSAPKIMTLPVGLQLLRVAFASARNQHYFLAGLVVGIVPMVILFLVLQRHYIKGIVMTGLKG